MGWHAPKRTASTSFSRLLIVSREDLDTLADDDLSDLAILNTIFQADSLDGARVFWPNDPEVGEASQRVRLALGLSSDTSVSCE